MNLLEVRYPKEEEAEAEEEEAEEEEEEEEEEEFCQMKRIGRSTGLMVCKLSEGDLQIA